MVRIGLLLAAGWRLVRAAFSVALLLGAIETIQIYLPGGVTSYNKFSTGEQGFRPNYVASVLDCRQITLANTDPTSITTLSA